MSDWQDMLAQVRARWTSAIEEGDTRTLRNTLLKAAVFAACTAHTTVEQAEYEYTVWCDTGEFPVDGTNLAGQKASAVMTADELVERFTIDDFREIGDGWQLAAILQQNVYGLGTAKASFAAALVGFPEPYCLDTHGLQKAREDLGLELTLDQIRGRARRWKFYREIGDKVFGNAAAQWSYFAQAVPAFAEGGHRAYFQTVL